jgi:lysophospholipase L1-like esterase
MARRRCVVLFGDSRAADWSAPEVEGFRFVNRGTPGESSAQARGRFEAHVAPLRPDVVVVQVGINDLTALGVLPGQREVQATTVVANCIANVEQIVERATALGARVVVTTIFPLGAVPAADELPAAVEAVNAALRAMEGGRRAGAVSVLDAYAVLADDEGRTRPAYSLDLLHLTEAGYGRLNEALAAHLAALEW